MELSAVLDILKEFLFVVIVLSSMLLIAFYKGRQTITNIILGLYFGVFFSLQFPYYQEFQSSNDNPALAVAIFLFFTVIMTILFQRILPREYSERTFEGFGRKVALALAGTVLVLVFSYQVIPLPELINIATPLTSVFANTDYFFWLLLIPVAIVFWMS